ncbi:putative membrane protein YtaB [Bacillus licheniformis]|nr:putative membrane protein YtaB [Bacillus licheniformis]
MKKGKIVTAVIVFLVIYALFSLAGILFPVDREWYESLNKPDWTPSGRLIGTVWSVLFAFISLAAALVYAAYDMRKAAAPFWIMLIINYVFNQAFSYFQFTQKNLLAAAVDSFFVAITLFRSPLSHGEFTKRRPFSLSLMCCGVFSRLISRLRFTG